MKKWNKLFFAGIAAVPLLFSGCATDDNFTPAPDVANHTGELKNVIIDDQLENDIRVEYVRRWLSETGVTNIAIRGRVRTSTFCEWVFCAYKNITLAYRFAWYNDKGVEVPENTTPKWFTVEVQYDEEIGFTSVAPNKECKDFKLFIKLLKPEDTESFKKAQPAIEKKEEANAISENAVTRKGTVASQVKTAPTAVTPLKTSPKNSEEAEADAAAVRQATPPPKAQPAPAAKTPAPAADKAPAEKKNAASAADNNKKG